jgi:microcompartment protein CcmL/EutN
MGKSLGFIEISGVTAAIDALDIMCKTADVSLETWERKLGGRLVTLIVSGEIAAVKQAVEAASMQAIKKPVAFAVIANPHEEVTKIVELSKSRINKLSEKSSKEFQEV